MSDPDPAGDATLEAFRLADSFLPVGSYAVSSGLEQAVESDAVTDAEELESFLQSHLEWLLGRADLVALRAAHAASHRDDLSDVCTADRRLTAVTTAAEFRDSAESQGGRLLSLQRDLDDGGLLEDLGERVDRGDSPGNYPVVLGAVAAAEDIAVEDACLLCCHGFVTATLGAAQRLMPVGHTAAQRILRDLQPAMRHAVAASEDRPIDRMAPFAPAVDVLAAEHERAERRLFVS